MDAKRATDGQTPEVAIQEITLALVDHPAVVEVSVVPCQRPGGGQQPVAFVVTRGACSESELQRHVREKLGLEAGLQRVVFLNALPRSVSGKVDRRRLAAGQFTASPPSA
jgi:propionyl-CoA synthetase